MRVIVALLLALAVAAGTSRTSVRITDGSITTIDNYPSIASMLFQSGSVGFRFFCGGSILNERSFLTATHCIYFNRETAPEFYGFRVGSTYSNSGGSVHHVSQFIHHPNFNSNNLDSDISIARTTSRIVFSNVVQPARIAGSNYNVADHQSLWAAGWGRTEFFTQSEELRHVELLSVNHATCIARYADRNVLVNDNMICAGWLDVDERGQCSGDSGGPLYHNGVVVGVCSFGLCDTSRYPSVNVRVSRYTSWIQQNA